MILKNLLTVYGLIKICKQMANYLSPFQNYFNEQLYQKKFNSYLNIANKTDLTDVQRQIKQKSRGDA